MKGKLVMNNNVVDIQLRIYESYNNGLITEDVKDNLLLVLEDANKDVSKDRKKAIKRLTTIVIGVTAVVAILYALKKNNNKKENESNKAYDNMITECNNLINKANALKEDIIQNKPTNYKEIDKKIDGIMAEADILNKKANANSQLSSQHKMKISGHLINAMNKASSARNANWKNEDDNI